MLLIDIAYYGSFKEHIKNHVELKQAVGYKYIAEDAVQFYQEVGERLEKFGLELAQEKTNIINFSRFRKEEKTKFEFLGFEFGYFCPTPRKGKISNSIKSLSFIYICLDHQCRPYPAPYSVVGSSILSNVPNMVAVGCYPMF